MDLSLSDEQKQLQECAERFVRDKYAFENRRRSPRPRRAGCRRTGRSSPSWAGSPFPFSEEDGGIGFGAIGTMIVMEQFGKGLVLEPFLPTVVLGGGMIAAAGSAAQKEALLAPMIEGKKQFAFAWLERQSRYNLADVSLKATKEGNGWSLSGQKGVVYNAASADNIIVLARTAGGAREENGLTLFVVDGKAKGLTRRDYPTQDALRASELTFDKVSVGADAVLGKVDGGFPVVEDAVDRAIVALCAEATGCMDAINAATLEYIKTRKQFGVPIGKFQVLQHRMVDCFTNAQEARSMTLMATLKIEDKDADRAPQGGVRRQGPDRQVGQVLRPERGADARRHGRHRRALGQPLLQAADHDRPDVRQPAASPDALQQPRDGGLSAFICAGGRQRLLRRESPRCAEMIRTRHSRRSLLRLGGAPPAKSMNAILDIIVPVFGTVAVGWLIGRTQAAVARGPARPDQRHLLCAVPGAAVPLDVEGARRGACRSTSCSFSSAPACCSISGQPAARPRAGHEAGRGHGVRASRRSSPTASASASPSSPTLSARRGWCRC